MKRIDWNASFTLLSVTDIHILGKS